MKKFLFFWLFLLTITSSISWGQTLPSTFDLSSGSYTLTDWPAASSAGTYPSNMYFHRSSTQDPGISVEMTTNYTGAYNLTSGTRINGLDNDGFSFVNTGTNGNLGAAVLGLNSSGRTGIQVSWTGGTVAQTDGSRVYAIRLQYKVGSGSWTDVPGPIEYNSSGQSNGHSTNFGPTTLPSECNNQSELYLRWKYYSLPGGSGTRPRLRVDDITITSSSGSTTPTKLAVTTINGGISPSANTPFSVVVQSQDNSSSPANVTSNTSIVLSLQTGSGTLGGTLTGTILAGTSNVIISGVTYNLAETGVSITATRTSGDPLSPGTSSTFTVLEQATQLYFVSVPVTGQNGFALSTISVEARRSDNTKDLNYTGAVTLSKNSGPGTISGTLTVSAVAGTANFTNVKFDQSGNYTLAASATGLTGAVSDTIKILGLTSVILPQYIQGTGTTNTNNNRVPFAFRVTLSNLKPNSTYRFINQVVNFSDGPTSNGAGNCYFMTSNVDSPFVRTTNPSLSVGPYGEFTTDGSGSYTGWFITEPTGNVRFVPGGYISMRIRLNDGEGGTTAVSFLTTEDSVKVINYSTENHDSAGTAIYGNSFATSKDFVFLYDNVSGAGRPITGTFIESDGVNLSTITQIAQYYKDNVDNVNGAWGAIIPNQLSDGIRRIERRSFTDGSIVFANTDADGLWPSGANTVNPDGSLTPIVITSDDAPLAIAKTLNLTALIEGLYNGSFMQSDTVTAEIRNANLPYNVIESKKIILNSSGVGTASFYNVSEGTNYYLSIKHRNALHTWSSSTQQFTSGTLNYDFTSSASQAFGNNQVLIGTKYCIYSGDVSDGVSAGVQDGYIDIFDDFEIYNDSYGGIYRLLTDLTLDGFVDIFDDLIVYNNSYNGITAIYPGFPRPSKK